MTERLVAAVAGVVVLLAVVGLLVGTAAFLGTFAGAEEPTDTTDQPRYDVDHIFVEPIPAEGQVEVPPMDSGVVAIDMAHMNDADGDDIQELTNALVAANQEVRTIRSSDEFGSVLADADALVVIEPERAYDNQTGAIVEEFVEDGGQLLLMGGPTTGEIDAFAVIERSNAIDSIANRFGIAFGEDYLYDHEANDGNHRNILAAGTDHELLTDVSVAALYTATHVSAADGDPLLVTNETAQRAESGDTGTYPVAIVRGNVMAVGDASFMTGETYNVADNEHFIAAIVTFLADDEE